MPKICSLSPERQAAIRQASRERTRNWNDRRTAAGRCHRCPRLVETPGWFCRRCRIETAQLRALAHQSHLLAAHQREGDMFGMRNS